MKRQALGRGLDALIGGPRDVEVAVEEEVGLQTLRLSQIAPSTRQPRSSTEEANIDELAASISEHGLLQPLLVRPAREAGKFELIAGERRWRAAHMVGLENVPVVVWDAGDREALELALVENLQRENLSPLDCARAFRTLMEEFALTQEQVAARVGRSRSAVSNTLRLLSLPERAQAALDAGHITEGHARALLSIEGIERQMAALRVIIDRKISVRDAERLAKRYQATPVAPVASREAYRQKKTRVLDPNLLAAEEKLRMTLGTMVQILQGPKNGVIEIEFYSDEDVDRILSIILNDHS